MSRDQKRPTNPAQPTLSPQIYLLEQEKQRLLLASDKVDDAMRKYREKINGARLDRMARNRVFETLKQNLDVVKAELIKSIEHSNEVVEEKEQVRRACSCDAMRASTN